MAKLLLESGGGKRELKVTGPITVGRSPSAAVFLDDKTLSREHTQFYLENGRLHVRDMESKNGTYLNGTLIRRPEPLKHGDRVKVGSAIFTVVFEPGDALPVVAAPVMAQAPAPRPAASRSGSVTQTAQTSPARARTRPAEEREPLGTPAVMVFFYRIVLLGVIVVGAYFSKGVFHWLFGRFPS